MYAKSRACPHKGADDGCHSILFSASQAEAQIFLRFLYPQAAMMELPSRYVNQQSPRARTYHMPPRRRLQGARSAGVRIVAHGRNFTLSWEREPRSSRSGFAFDRTGYEFAIVEIILV